MSTFEHLAKIDAAVWPAIAQVPQGRFFRHSALSAEKAFAKAADAAGISLCASLKEAQQEQQSGPLMQITHDALFARLAERGWLGLAESFAAGEWAVQSANDLSEVLLRLLRVGYQPGGRRVKPVRPVSLHPGGQLPPLLVQMSSLAPADGTVVPSMMAGLYSSGVATSLQQAGSPMLKFLEEPIAVERADVLPAQERAMEALLDLAYVTYGTDVVQLCADSSLLAQLGAQRGALVDVLCDDAEVAAAIAQACREQAETAEKVQVTGMPHPVPTRAQWRGRYDAIVCVERFETLGEQGQRMLVDAMDRMLAARGTAAMQMVVATAALTPVCAQALAPLRTYIWPGLHYVSAAEFSALLEKYSKLRVHSATHAASHLEQTLQLQIQIFNGNRRNAAAAGVDPVLRRLWLFCLSLQKAMVSLGALDFVQFGIHHRQ